MKKIKLIENFKAREYQESIFANSINKNSLVVLPTGLGKTVIAIMQSVFYFNKFEGDKRILFLAPTKPLVEQQEKSFKSFFVNSDEFEFQVLTGQVSPKKREKLYQDNDFIFSTPQLIENDIVNRIINPKDFCLVVIDEAHRATGNYAYCFICEEFDKYNSKILSLTASPGTDLNQIREVMENLRVEHLEYKKYTDSDVKPYVNETKTEHIEVEISSEFEEVRKLLNDVYLTRIAFLKKMEFFEGKLPSQITKKDILDLQRELRVMISSGDADENIWKAISVSAGVMKLQHGIELFESQEISVAHSYFYNFFRAGGDSSKAAEELVADFDFRDAFDKISKLKKKGILHPKLIKLKELVNDELLNNSDLKMIIFAQYRESAQKIVEELSQIKELRPTIFVGQSKKGEVAFSQKMQKEVIEKFREGEFNILVSTSVGEEGLDIPKVDLVIFYEPVPSAIRTIQRIGRTGRFKQGKAYILQTKGTKDVVLRFVASAKERKMYNALEKIKNEQSSFAKSEKSGLGRFLGSSEGSSDSSKGEGKKVKEIILSDEEFKKLKERKVLEF